MKRQQLAPEARMAKLPAWAREEISHLRLRLTEAERLVCELGEVREPCENELFWRGGPTFDAYHPLPSIALYGVRLGADWRSDLSLHCQDGGLEINSGGGPLSVEPRASNLIRVRVL